MELYLAIFIDYGEREILSIHKTEETAQKALDIHQAFKKKEYEENNFGFKYNTHRDWVIHKYELKD